ncbi:MAG: amidinotransferase, partial [Actinomycetota bacterium]|nr:amidinotransferase [Actinomycetota bacterium]
MTEAVTRTFGCQSMVAPLRRVLVRQPGGLARWREYGWRAEPDAAGIAAEHEAFVALLEEAGAEVLVTDPDEANPDAVYVYDPALVADAGAV